MAKKLELNKRSQNQNQKLSVKLMDEIINKTITTIQVGKLEIFEIAEITRKELQELELKLKSLKQQATRLISQVDELEKKYYDSRIRLAEVSKNFDSFSDESVKDAYEKANEYRTQLTVMKEREFQVRQDRDNTERKMRDLTKTIGKAENILNQLGVIESYLSQELGELQETLEDLEKKKDISIKIIRAQEEERRRVAREVHDGPAQSLANMVFRAEYCERLLDAKEDRKVIKDELEALKKQVRLSLKDVRRIIFDLRPMTLDDLGLVPAVRRLIQEIEKDGSITGEIKVFGQEKRLHKDLEIALFRTVQEALNNIIKHSKTKEFWVKVDFRGENIRINVRDEGVGFDPGEIIENFQSEQFGLINMEERITSLRGEFKLTSKPSQGTRIFIKVPTL